MIVLLDTSTAVCDLTLVDDEQVSHNYRWQADRSLARDLLAYLRERLSEHGATFDDLTGLGVMRGPGSFTGLRIGMTVLNTLADDRQVPIVGVVGSDWQSQALRRLRAGENDRLVMPEYGREANITAPRK